MRRIIIVLLCLLMLCSAVSAAGGISDLQGSTAIAPNGTCRVTLTMQLSLDEVPENLVFPVPLNARDITLNAEPARVELGGNVRNVNLKGVVSTPGTHTFTIQYALPDGVVRDKSGKLWLDMELLSGFGYPISNMTLTIRFPGELEYRPSFLSTYHQEDVESVLDVTVDGSVIVCTLKRSLNDREKLTMRLRVTENQFPQPISKQWSMGVDDILMYLLLALAAIYWVVTMRFWPGKITPRGRAPEGVTAGEVGCCLTGCGGDLTMMVLSWAEMGYLRVQLDENGRVLLHKRMDMGNERSGYENSVFRAMFAKRKTMDTSGYAFAHLWERVSRKAPRRSLYRKGSGNPYIFRALVAGAGILGGFSMANAFADDTVWVVVLSVLLCALATVASWLIQKGPYVLLLRSRMGLLTAAACSAVWIMLGAFSGEIGVAVLLVCMQWLGGFAAAYGGRRSSPGSQVFRDILGLRQFLTSTNRKKLAAIQKSNPYFYYSLAPYAYALGVDKRFAAKMGKLRLPQCTFLVSGVDGHLTAAEWNRILREAVEAMDAGHNRQWREKLLIKK